MIGRLGRSAPVVRGHPSGKGYKLEGFSVEWLMRFATALGQDVVIEIRPRKRAKGVGEVRVVGAA